MKKSEFLQAAIDKYLWSGISPDPDVYGGQKTRFICSCIDRYAKPESTPAAYEILLIISKRLGNHFTIISWLTQVAGIPAYQFPPKVIQAYRKRWAESLIEEFKAQGD